MIANYHLLEIPSVKAAPSGNVWIDVPCPICGSEDSQPVLQGPGWNDSEQRIYAVALCNRCRVWYTNPLPAGLPEMAGEPVSDFIAAAGATAILKTGLGRAERRGELLVHFGLADPVWPRWASRLGWRVMLWKARPREVPESWWLAGGYAVFGSLDDLVAQYRNQITCITCADWLERQPEVPPVLASWRNLLHPDGRLLLLVPNLAGQGLRKYGGLWRGLDLPYRRVHFTVGSLTQLLQAAGWRIRRVRTYGCLDWLEASARRWREWCCSNPRPLLARWWQRWRTCRVRNWLAASLAPLVGQGDWLLVEATAPGPD